MVNYDISGSTMPVYVGKSGFADASSAKALNMEIHLYRKLGHEISIMSDVSNYHGWMVLGSSGGGESIGVQRRMLRYAF